MHASTNIQKIAAYKEWLLFMLKVLLIWLSWKSVSYVLGVESLPIEQRIFPTVSMVWETLNDADRHFVLNGAERVLNLLGYATENTGYILRIEGSRGVGLGNYCLGFNLLYYFSLLLLITKVKWNYKLAGILVSIVVINVLNIIRIAVFNLVLIYGPALLPLMHDYVFNGVVAGCLFLWYLLLLRNN